MWSRVGCPLDGLFSTQAGRWQTRNTKVMCFPAVIGLSISHRTLGSETRPWILCLLTLDMVAR